MPTRVKISVLDDDHDEWDLIKSYFLEHGIMTTEFFDKSKVLIATLNKNEPRVIIIDVNLAGETGYQAMLEIQKICKECYFIIITEHVNEEVIIDFLNSGADQFIKKSPSYYEKLTIAVIKGREEVKSRIEQNMKIEQATKKLQEKAERIDKKFLTEPPTKDDNT